MGLFTADDSRGKRGHSKPSRKTSEAIRQLTCGQVMLPAHKVYEDDSMSYVVKLMTSKGWDHVMVVDDRDSLVGRVHAVDLLKLVCRNQINMDMFWMEATPISQSITQPPLQVKSSTPLMAAAALMLTHDLNQVAVTDAEGALAGYVSNAVVARHLPRFLL